MQARRPSRSFHNSVPARLALFALLFGAVVGGAHVLALDRLLRVREVSGEVRNRWLDSISVLYNVGRRLSDLRGLEADLILIPEPARRDKVLSDLPGAMDEVAKAVAGYRPLAGDREEMLAFN